LCEGEIGLWIGKNGFALLKYEGKETINFTTQQKVRKADSKGNSLDRVFSVD